MGSVIFVGQRVNVENIIKYSYETKQFLNNAIVKKIFKDKVWVIADQESNHSEWCSFSNGGHFYNSSFKISPVN